METLFVKVVGLFLRGFLGTVDFMPKMFLRHNFGKRYVGGGKIVGFVFMGWLLWSFGGAIMVGGSAPVAYGLFLAAIALAIIHRIRASQQANNGILQHSQYDGESWVLTLLERQKLLPQDFYTSAKKQEYYEFGIKLFVDPLITLIAGSLLGEIDYLASLWLQLSAVAMALYAAIGWAFFRRRAMDEADAMMVTLQKQRNQAVQTATDYARQVSEELTPVDTATNGPQRPATAAAVSRPRRVRKPASSARQQSSGFDPNLRALMDEGEQATRPQPVEKPPAAKPAPASTLDPRLQALLDDEEEEEARPQPVQAPAVSLPAISTLEPTLRPRPGQEPGEAAKPSPPATAPPKIEHPVNRAGSGASVAPMQEGARQQEAPATEETYYNAALMALNAAFLWQDGPEKDEAIRQAVTEMVFPNYYEDPADDAVEMFARSVVSALKAGADPGWRAMQLENVRQVFDPAKQPHRVSIGRGFRNYALYAVATKLAGHGDSAYTALQAMQAQLHSAHAGHTGERAASRLEKLVKAAGIQR